MTFIVGLTGGIGSGKSTVADLLAGKGAALVDTDVIAHQLTAPQGTAMAAIAEVFGPGVLTADGALDRAAMRRLAFSDPAAKARLEAILHPLIRQRSDEMCRLETSAPYIVLVVPLLVESANYRRRIDRLLVVDCQESTQIARVMARSGLSTDQVRAIIAVQATREQRREVADDLLTNDGDLAELQPQIDRLHQHYILLAAAKAGATR
ncbi:MAG TPA: dephospho-CoA kinase [Accumulibacter sp.]|nr:dephospho-CoA kinase [Accumulibacter sp.]HMW17360.1 dephospho-CoA kinase [Accumulibacter sp.]HMX21952.1 dephospho-CoA kinase [Accumulibacter sp.]HMY06503.1 dephospho-CoA kinase [Accumulibacter sp.]HNC17135.1 dephospho-CoA kinase [Accumulibacter sp.]